MVPWHRAQSMGNVHHKGKLATFDNGIAELIQVNKERHRHITVLEA